MESVPWCDSEREEAGSVYKVQKLGVANRDQKRRGGGGQSSAIGCLLWPISMPVCLRGGSRMLRRQRRSGAWGGTQAWHHLHSTATVFCVGEAEDGLMPVSDEPDDVDAVVWDTVDQKSGQITKDQKWTKSNTVTFMIIQYNFLIL